ncbi:hypothetical protein [Nocardia sp. NPDC058633]|uniref:hypothetical protein n=1 Tax=Nocardia sp. NPDC058633 TaxID=3346568 RepID=UPI003657DD3D
MTSSGRTRALVAGYCALLTMIIVGPLAGSGYLLLRDAVSTPRSYLTDSALGLGAAAPRAVPQDALLAVLSPVIDGGLLVKAILIVALWSAGYGAAVLARRFLSASTGAQLVAATLALWNPYVAERLLQGHWSLLAGYAALPWTALAAARIRTAAGTTAPSEVAGATRRFRFTGHAGALGGWAALTASFAAAGLTPTGSLLAAVIGLALIGRRALIPGIVVWVVTCAPWLTATALGSGAEPSDPTGVSAFAARAEPWLGTLGSLAGLGGIWNGEAVPASRTTPLALVGTLLLLGIVACGVRAVWALGRDGRALLVIAAVAIVLPALGATSGGLAAGEWLMVHVPGAGLLRDTQKYVALAMPAYALCAAAACRTVATAGRRLLTEAPPGADSADTGADDSDATPSRVANHPRAESDTADELPIPAANKGIRPGVSGIRATAVFFVLLLTLPMADLAWGVGGAMRPVHYPAGWQQVVDHIDGPGDVAVLPAGMFRRFPYSGTAPVLDPAPRILPNDVLQTGELRVRGYAVTGEGSRARTVEEALLRGAPSSDLAALGVGWILIERTSPGPLGNSEKTLATAESIYQDRDLALYRIPSHHLLDTATPAQRRTSVAAHLLWAFLLLAGLTAAALRPHRTPSEDHPASSPVPPGARVD